MLPLAVPLYAPRALSERSKEETTAKKARPVILVNRVTLVPFEIETLDKREGWCINKVIVLEGFRRTKTLLKHNQYTGRTTLTTKVSDGKLLRIY